MKDINPIFSMLVSPSLIVLGWIIVHYLTIRREKQAEARKAVSFLLEELEKLEEEAIVYHTSEQRDVRLELKIKQTIARLDIKFKNIQKVLSLHEVPLWRLRFNITLKNFETANFQKQEIDSEIIRGVQLSVNEIIKTFYLL